MLHSTTPRNAAFMRQRRVLSHAPLRAASHSELAPIRIFANFPGMKLLWAIIAYVVIAGILGWGLILTMKGNPWLFIIGFLAYVVAFGKIGCLPKKSH